MARFQETTTHDDTVEKRPLSPDDVRFLAELQHALNTQDTMGQADPRFWVIAQSKEVPAPSGMAERHFAVDADGEQYNSIKELSERAKETIGADAAWIVSSCVGLDDAVEEINTNPELSSMPGIPFSMASVMSVREIVKDTMFLTHADCEDHLRKYGYNYEPDAHAFAMTAHRSPCVEKLLGIIRSVDWGAAAYSLVEKKEES